MQGSNRRKMDDEYTEAVTQQADGNDSDANFDRPSPSPTRKSPGSTNGGLPTPVKRTLGGGLGRPRGQFKRPNGPFALPNLYPNSREEPNGAAGGDRPMEVDEREERRADDDRSQEEGKSPNKATKSPAWRSPFSSQNRHSQNRVQNFVTTAGVAEVPPLVEPPAEANGGERREERVHPRPRLPSPPPSQHLFDHSLDDRVVLGNQYRPHASTPSSTFGRPPLVHCTSTVTIPPADGVIQQNGRPPVNPGATAHIKVNGVTGPKLMLAPKVPNPTAVQVADLAAQLKANGFSSLTPQELRETARVMLETGRRPSGSNGPARPSVVRETLPVTSPPVPPNGPQFANSAQQPQQQQRKPAAKRTAAEMNGDLDGGHLPADLLAELVDLRALKAEYETVKNLKAEMMSAMLQQGNQLRRELRDGLQQFEKKFMAEVQDLRISFNESRTTENGAQRSSSSGWGYGQQQRRAGSAGGQPGDTVDIDRLVHMYHEQPLDGALLDDARLMPPPGDFRNSRSSGYGGENSWFSTDQQTTTGQAASPEMLANLFGALEPQEAPNAPADADVTKSGKPKKLARPKTDKKPGPTPLEKFGAPAYNHIERARVDNLMASDPRASSTFAVLCKWMFTTADRQKPMDARDTEVTTELRQVMEERFPASGVPYANTRWKKWIKEENTRAVRLAESYDLYNASQAPVGM
ncbi:hypothetical protein M3Y99_00825400 [Aphelenchoides fujianensis]|nr:hypothetical protein M3Y99_00825400 [Aphelenchoides fujianensis]